MKEKRQDPEVLKKMDGGLRRLMRMLDNEIATKLEAHEERRKKLLEEFEHFEKEPPSKESEEGAHVAEARLRHLPWSPHPLWDLLVIEKREPLRRIKSRAIVQFHGNPDDLQGLGLEVRTKAHDIFTVRGTLDQLADLAAQPATQRVRLPRLLFPTVENAAAQAEVDTARQDDAARPAGLDGQGVIVGIIDSALDVTHHGFREAAALHDSRVLYYWVHWPDSAAAPGDTPDDYTTAAAAGTVPDFSNPTALGYGLLYDQAYINNAFTEAGGPYGNAEDYISREPHPVRAEHGTHVAGIAAGSGRGAGGAAGAHIGAAPGADIIHVAYGANLGLSADATFEDCVIDALDLIFRAADFHNQPAVVNVSQGTNLGPHNGTTPFDQARDNMLNSFTGRAIVWAAGNDNNDDGFQSGTIPAGTTEDLTMTIVPMLDSLGVEHWMDRWLEIWYSGPELTYEIEANDGTPPPAVSPLRGPGDNWTGTLKGFDVFAECDAETSPGLRNLRIQIERATSAADWAIRLHNTDAARDVKVHAWTCPQGQHASLAAATRHEMTMGDPGCAKSVLTVGAAQKHSNPANPAQGETITDYSGAGPTLDNRIKPEIVAVGGISGGEIWSTNSNQADGYIGMIGTSMAAPLVAGAIALLFEAHPNLDQDTIKALLAATANTDDLNPTDPGYVADDEEKYGFGRMRLLAVSDLAAPLRERDVWVRTADDDYGLEPFPGDCYCCSPDIRVLDGAGTEITRLVWGTTYTVEVTVRNMGFREATGTNVRLKYTRPWLAPNDWKDAAPAQTVDVPALGFTDPLVQFSWTPNQATVGAQPEETHFCLLVEVEWLPDDALTYGAGDPWLTNIKSHNNVALQNLHIY